MNKFTARTFALVLASGISCSEKPAEIEMHALSLEGSGARIGTISARNTQNGAEFSPNLSGLSPGLHGFHVHTAPDCGPAEKDGKPVPGLAAQGHFDPDNTGVHAGPAGNGHLGDLPALKADQNSKVVEAVVAPRLKTSDLKGRALIIHGGGDNYSDSPEKLGGGGPRVACGVVP
ncbi:MAG: superoxide dismutase family protein [Methylococcaceae bacterium]|nr:superoxide dismutase family protein [Methylococcaceae bacterium]